MAFKTDDPNMLNEWLVVGPMHFLVGTSEQSPKTTTLLGCEITLWRAGDGSAVHGRCGRDDLLVDVRYHYVWVCPSGKPSRELFAFPEYDEPGRRIVDCGGIGVHVSGLRIIENFLDMAHFPYVHTDYLGKVPHTEVADYKVEVEATTGEIWATDCRFWQPRTSASANEGMEAQYKYRVMQPFSAMLYKSCVAYADRLDALGLFVQPVDETRSIAYCLIVYFDDETSDTDLIAFQHTIFGQDKPILENHLLKRIPLEGRLEAATRADMTAVTYRKSLRDRGMRFGVHPR
ncbi:MAG: aromatic ring-hydroxylating dioxygenase subunit alpha [Piscinibacter sp.]|uniref:aromatic ring-hydroxylating dioxygenase subunit alpha n=1 Tax=Piscinibacter sp. TaxID=1903157 RepID=UPI003D0B634F